MYTISKQDKIDSLIENLKAREREVFGYQINIDNYTIAVKIAGADMADFVEELKVKLGDERKQQKIAQLILDVILKQLEDEDIDKLLEES
jgi:acylphosphatase